MARYNLNWNKDDFVLTIAKGDDVSEDAVSELVFPEIGEVPDSASHPQVDQHLRNVALQQGVDNYGLVTVVNETGNERLDKYAQRATDDDSSRMNQRRDMLVVDNPRYAHMQNTGADQDPVDPATGELADAEDGEQASDTKPEIVEKSDTAKADEGKSTTSTKTEDKEETKPAAGSKAGGEDGKAATPPKTTAAAGKSN